MKVQNFPEDKNGYGIEFAFDEKCRTWKQEFYLIFKGELKKVNEKIFRQSTSEKIAKAINMAVKAVQCMNIRKVFKEYNPDCLDLAAYQGSSGEFIIRLTSDSGDLLLEFDGKKFLKKEDTQEVLLNKL